jgi:[protein-PII] uridylyltransferase
MDTKSDRFRAMTELLICAPDAQGLFSRISGAIALAGANILSAKIFTLKDGMAVELFQIQDTDGHAFDKPDRLARLSVFIHKAVTGELDLAREIARTHLTYPSRMDVFKVPPRVFIENKASANYTVIEVGGRDRIGFLYSVTRALSDLDLQIATAHITTYGERAVDVFYVKDMFGMKIQHETKLRQIHKALLSVLSRGFEKKAG